MIIMNEMMLQDCIKEIHKRVKLPHYMQSILDSGFITIDGCVFFKQYLERLKDFTNIKTEYSASRIEYEINELNSDDYCRSNQLQKVLLFCSKFNKKWKSSGMKLPYMITVSWNGYGYFITFNVCRKDDIPSIKIDKLESSTMIIIYEDCYLPKG